MAYGFCVARLPYIITTTSTTSTSTINTIKSWKKQVHGFRGTQLFLRFSLNLSYFPQSFDLCHMMPCFNLKYYGNFIKLDRVAPLIADPLPLKLH